MRNLAIARRYAKALLLIGKDDGQIDTYRRELQQFADLLAQNPQLEQAINNPLHIAKARRNVLQGIVEKLGFGKVMSHFLVLLFDKNRIKFISQINDFYQKLADEVRGVGRAHLVSATELPAETIEKIRATLSKRTGKDIILEVKQDAGLIGGLVTRIGDLVLDGSIKTQLLNMKESLKRGERV